MVLHITLTLDTTEDVVNTASVISSTTWPWCKRSYSAGVAETNTVWGNKRSNSLNFRGRLSMAEGRRKP